MKKISIIITVLVIVSLFLGLSSYVNHNKDKSKYIDNKELITHELDSYSSIVYEGSNTRVSFFGFIGIQTIYVCNSLSQSCTIEIDDLFTVGNFDIVLVNELDEVYYVEMNQTITLNQNEKIKLIGGNTTGVINIIHYTD